MGVVPGYYLYQYSGSKVVINPAGAGAGSYRDYGQH